MVHLKSGSWCSNQEWRSNCTDTVVGSILKKIVLKVIKFDIEKWVFSRGSPCTNRVKSGLEGISAKFKLSLRNYLYVLASGPPPVAPCSPFGFEAFKEETFENYGVTHKRTDYWKSWLRSYTQTDRVLDFVIYYIEDAVLAISILAM